MDTCQDYKWACRSGRLTAAAAIILSLVQVKLVSLSPASTVQKMKFSAISTPALAAIASAMPAPETTKAECVKPYLCCGSLTTPLDSTVDPILAALGVNGANVVGEVGLLCMFFSLSALLSNTADKSRPSV